MSTTNSTRVLDRFLDSITECLTPEVAEKIANLRIDPALQARLDYLAAQSSRGELKADEESEYRDYVEGIDMVAILKAKARLSLRRHGS